MDAPRPVPRLRWGPLLRLAPWATASECRPEISPWTRLAARSATSTNAISCSASSWARRNSLCASACPRPRPRRGASLCSTMSRSSPLNASLRRRRAGSSSSSPLPLPLPPPWASACEVVAHAAMSSRSASLSPGSASRSAVASSARSASPSRDPRFAPVSRSRPASGAAPESGARACDPLTDPGGAVPVPTEDTAAGSDSCPPPRVSVAVAQARWLAAAGPPASLARWTGCRGCCSPQRALPLW